MSQTGPKTKLQRLRDELVIVLKSSGANLDLTISITLQLETEKQLEVYLAWVLKYLKLHDKYPTLNQYVEAMEKTLELFPVRV